VNGNDFGQVAAALRGNCGNTRRTLRLSGVEVNSYLGNIETCDVMNLVCSGLSLQEHKAPKANLRFAAQGLLRRLSGNS